MIVKIQRGQPPFGRQNEVLVYTRKHNRWWLGDIDPDVDKWMGNRQKAFAYGHIEGTVIVIDSEAPWQHW